MLEELVKNKKTKYVINLNEDKNYSCWILKEMDKTKNNNLKLYDNKNTISYGALSLKLQKINGKKPKKIRKYYEIRLNNLSDDIFPFERNPTIKFIYYNSNKENLFGENFYERKNSTFSENKKEEYKNQILEIDIPEMIFYKYKYDKQLFYDLINDSEDESDYIFNIIQGKSDKFKNKNDVINCINELINLYKNKFLDIPYIIYKIPFSYNKLFTVEEATTILSLYDAEYIKFKVKQKKILKLFNQTLLLTNNRYKIDFSYINNATNELDLDLALSYIGFLITIFNNNSKVKFCKSLMNLNINLTSKNLLQSILEDECDLIASKFCLSPDDVVYNLKVLKKELTGELIEANNDCLLMDLCLNKVNELSKKNKTYRPNYLLQKAINYHIIGLSSHPYIAKIIYETYLKITTLSTYPTEKGKIILNSSHPSFRCKRIKNCSLEKLIAAMKMNENNFSEIFLDIEKCQDEGLITVKYEIDISSKSIEDLVSLLNKAVNGFYEEKKEISNIVKNNDNLSDSDDNESSKAKSDLRKNILARKIVVKNMIIEKEFTQKYFIHYIKKYLHNIAEKNLIEKISKKFNSILNRKYINNLILKSEEEEYCYSIFFLNLNTFCFVVIDKNNKIKYHNIFKSFFMNKKDNNSEINKQKVEINELNREFLKHPPKVIILGTNNIGSFQLLKFLRENHSDVLVIFSDYFSLLKGPKNYEKNYNEEEYYTAMAVDQYKFTINPLYFFMENYDFKYEKNFILNLKLDDFQEQINDIPLLNYCLEIQIASVANLFKFKFPKEKNTPDNYFCFMNGLGPITSKIIEENKNIKTIEDIKNHFKNRIKTNFEPFLSNENDMDIDNEDNKINYKLTDKDLFNNALYPLKINSLHNAIVNYVDSKEKIVNCILFYNENILECILPFKNIPDYIKDKKLYFKNYRMILCKIIEINIEKNEIILSNKLEDLEDSNKITTSEEESYLHKSLTDFKINQEEDYKISEIQRLHNIINIQKDKENKTLKKLIECTYLKNICLEEIKREIIAPDEYGHFCIRPSFLGEDHLFLTFSLIEDLTLNYDIIIGGNKKYIINNNDYKSIDEVSNFANKLLKKINEFKKSKYFKSPSQMKSIFDSIFTNINNKTNNYENINFINDIILCFMEDSPNYGLLFTKSKNNNYIIDYIEFLPDGYNFHNLFFENISLVINYYNENYEKENYKRFISSQIIYNIHSQIEDIDIIYEKFEEEKKEINKDLTKNKFLGKKIEKTEFNGWQDNNINEKNSNFWGDNDFAQNNNNENIDDIWGNNNENKEYNWGNNNFENNHKIKKLDNWLNDNSNEINKADSFNNNIKKTDNWNNNNEINNWTNDNSNKVKNSDSWGSVNNEINRGNAWDTKISDNINSNNKRENWNSKSKVDNWGNNNKSDNWGNNNKSENWNSNDKEDNWGSNNKTENWNSNDKVDNWGNNNKSDNWGNNNKEENWNSNEKTDNWGNNNKTENWKNNDKGENLGKNKKAENWNTNNKTENWNNNVKVDNWGSNNKSDNWGNNNKTENWNSSDKTDNWGNNNKTGKWGSKNKAENWNSNNKTVKWNNNNKADNWGGNDKSENWNSNDKADNWANSNKVDNWGSNNKSDNWVNNNNTDNWNKNNNTENWGSNDKSEKWNSNDKSEKWNSNDKAENWGNSNKVDNWGNNNKADNWGNNNSTDNWNNDNKKKDWNKSNKANNWDINNNRNKADNWRTNNNINKENSWVNEDNYNQTNKNDKWEDNNKNKINSWNKKSNDNQNNSSNIWSKNNSNNNNWGDFNNENIKDSKEKANNLLNEDKIIDNSTKRKSKENNWDNSFKNNNKYKNSGANNKENKNNYHKENFDKNKRIKDNKQNNITSTFTGWNFNQNNRKEEEAEEGEIKEENNVNFNAAGEWKEDKNEWCDDGENEDGQKYLNWFNEISLEKEGSKETQKKEKDENKNNFWNDKNNSNDINKYNKRNNNSKLEQNNSVYNASNSNYYPESYNNNYQGNNYKQNNAHNERNNQGSKNNNNNKNKKKISQWKDELNAVGKDDIKEDDVNDGEAITFENLDEFGGFKVEKENEEKDNNNSNKEKDNNNSNNNYNDAW